MKHLNQYKNDSFDLKALPLYITEYIIKKKLDTPIDSEDHYEYYPKTKNELIDNINELVENKIYDFNCIDTSAITNMSHLFDMSLKKLIKHNLKNINFDISRWDVNNVEDMSYMFYDCEKFNGNLSKWDISKVKNINTMFCLCSDFMGNGLKNWNVSKIKNMSGLFYKCKNLNCDLSGWNVSNVENMEYMFKDCTEFNCDLSNWNVRNVTNMSNMFGNCYKLNCDLSKWNVNKVKDMTFMFYNCDSLKNKPSWYKE